jgi:hypothetical protein
MSGQTDERTLRDFFFCFFIFVNLRHGEKNTSRQTNERTDGRTDERTNKHREGLQNRPRILPLQNVVSDRRTHALREFIYKIRACIICMSM